MRVKKSDNYRATSQAALERRKEPGPRIRGPGSAERIRSAPYTPNSPVPLIEITSLPLSSFPRPAIRATVLPMNKVVGCRWGKGN